MVGSAAACTAEPSAITNAAMSGTGNQVGTTRTYTCEGNYAWSDWSTGGKPSLCQENGKWSYIPFVCFRMPTQYIIP